MTNSLFKAQLIGMRRIRIFTFTEMPRPYEIVFTLYTDGRKGTRLTLVKSVSQGASSLFEVEAPTDIIFGHHYSVGLTDFPIQPLDVTNAVYFPEFDDMFNYDGDDLGSTYSKEETKFALWAPLAYDVMLRIEDDHGHHETFMMDRTEKGVYRTTVKGDLINCKYSYFVNNSGSVREATDPYGKGLSLNSTKSVVVDINQIKKMKKIKPTNPIDKPVASLIYEVGVRDFTEDSHTNIINKGKYLGFIEEGRTTEGGHPAGLDYLKLLGITHVQLNPIIDFRGVDDQDPNPTYNWGYDPVSFFGVEGSYSIDPENAISRLKEFRTMVDTLHKNNIRVIMDVVYNHIYNYMDSTFERILPNYFFRRRKDGPIANASGCGNDFATERYMVRKAIVDSIEYFTDVFDVDGFRFDLMGLMDIKTVNECVKVCKKHKPDAVIYGEGWNMGSELAFEEKACKENHAKLPEVGFFNDCFREAVKGSTFDKKQPGYIDGDPSFCKKIENCLSGSVLPYEGGPLFSTASQSINYVECHDNQTLFDKICECLPDEDTETKLKRVKIANAIVLLSFGVPFFHMGQEIGLSKHSLDNTYNVPKVNNMDWRLVDERWDLVMAIKEIMRFRVHNPYTTKLDTPEEIDKIISFYQEWEDRTFYSRLVDSDPNSLFSDIILAINPNDYACDFNLEGDYYLIVGPGGFPFGKQDIIVRSGFMAPLSWSMVGKKRDK